MGNKGDQLADRSTIAAEGLKERLLNLGAIRIKKMFGGYGVFEEDTMFSLVDKNGQIFFKADDTNLQTFEEAGSVKHSRMPYYTLPDKVLNDDKALLSWAQSSLDIAKKAK
jgi:DNA transformation protein